MNDAIETISLGNGTAFGNDMVNLVMQAGPIAKFVLLILLLFSLISWGIMLDKWLHFRRVFKSSEKFLHVFQKAENFNAVMTAVKSMQADPLSRIFMSGYRVLQRNANTDTDITSPLLARDARFLEMSIDDAILIETQVLEKRIPFLGTCGGVTPFIGLFGTVWGIMNSFQGIGMAGSASIAAVAPGIAEALVATAAGLAAAIPAVIAYNYFLGKVRATTVMFERFRSTFLASVS